MFELEWTLYDVCRCGVPQMEERVCLAKDVQRALARIRDAS